MAKVWKAKLYIQRMTRLLHLALKYITYSKIYYNYIYYMFSLYLWGFTVLVMFENSYKLHEP